MQKFKNNMSDGWLFTQELRFFRNFMRNWDRDVNDSDFFDIFANSNNSSSVETQALLKRHFPLETLAKCEGISTEREHRSLRRGRNDADEPKIVDIRVSRNVDGVIQELWNMDKASRARCRAMLEEWCDILERRRRCLLEEVLERGDRLLQGRRIGGTQQNKFARRKVPVYGGHRRSSGSSSSSTAARRPSKSLAQTIARRGSVGVPVIQGRALSSR